MTEPLIGQPAHVVGPRRLGRKPNEAAPGTQGVPKTPHTTVYTDANGYAQGVANGASGTVLTGNGTAAAPSYQAGSSVTRKIKTSNESISGSTTLDDDLDLLLAIAAGEQWQGYVCLFVVGAEADDFKFDLNLTSSGLIDYSAIKVPTGATGTAPYTPELGSRRDNDSAGDALETSGTLGSTANSEEVTILIYFSIRQVSGTGGCILRWAQNVAGGTTTVLRGSYLLAFKV